MNSAGLLHCCRFILKMADLGTGLRFKEVQVRAAIEYCCGRSGSLNAGKFSNATYARGVAGSMMVIMCHARELPLRCEKVIEQFVGLEREKTRRAQLQNMTDKIVQKMPAEMQQLKKLGKLGGRVLKPERSDASEVSLASACSAASARSERSKKTEEGDSHASTITLDYATTTTTTTTTITN